MKYINILIPAALVIYLIYRIYQNIQLNQTEGMTMQVFLLIFGIGIIIYRLIKLRNTRP